MKQNQIFFHGTYSNLTSYIFLSKNIKVFQWFSKSKFLSFITEVNQTMKMKQSQIFFQGTYSNLISFLIGPKILKYFNNFHNWDLSISLQKWAKTKIKIKRDICKSDNFSLFTIIYNVVHYLKLASANFYQILFFHQMITLQKL